LRIDAISSMTDSLTDSVTRMTPGVCAFPSNSGVSPEACAEQLVMVSTRASALRSDRQPRRATRSETVQRQLRRLSMSTGEATARAGWRARARTKAAIAADNASTTLGFKVERSSVLTKRRRPLQRLQLPRHARGSSLPDACRWNLKRSRGSLGVRSRRSGRFGANTALAIGCDLTDGGRFTVRDPRRPYR